MSIFSDAITKTYSTEYPSFAKGNVTWGLNNFYNQDILDGYLHSLYMRVDSETYCNLLAKHFTVCEEGPPGNNIVSIYVDCGKTTTFVKIDSSLGINDAYIEYDNYTCDKPVLRTLDFTDLIYTTEKIKRRTERKCMKYENCTSLQFVARGIWRNYRGGCLILGAQYVPPDFKEPVCLNTRRCENINDVILPKVRNYPQSFEEQKNNKSFQFLYYSSVCKTASKWNPESMNAFLIENKIPESIYEPNSAYTRKNF